MAGAPNAPAIILWAFSDPPATELDVSSQQRRQRVARKRLVSSRVVKLINVLARVRPMKSFSIILALLASSGVALAQSDSKQQPPKESAPAESSHAPGHDAQTGKPATGEKENNDLQKKQDTATKKQDEKKAGK